MDQIKGDIVTYLEKEGVKVLHFKYMDFEDPFSPQYVELAIEIKDEDVPKWNYFSSKVNQENKIVNTAYNEGIYKFVFIGAEDEDELEMLNQNLKTFYDNLQRKYFKVCPIKKRASVIVKVTHRCNLDCKYCYDKPYRERINADMSYETLDRLLKLLSEYAEEVQFHWHGGEPTVLGVDWFEKAYEEVISKYPMLKLKFRFMTNGTLVDDKWCELFEKYDIGAGVSYHAKFQELVRCVDHNSPNQDLDKKFNDKVKNLLITTSKNKKKFGNIDVVNSLNYKHQIEMYEFYKSLGMNCAFNHVFHTEAASENDMDLDVNEYVNEYLKYFKYWLYDKNGIKERSAEEMLAAVIGSVSRVTCINRDCRFTHTCINPVGDVYPCDKYYPEEYKSGNIFEIDSFGDVYHSKGYQLYCDEVQERFDKKCSKCGYWHVCKGGCNGEAFAATGTCKDQSEFYCKMFKLKFNGIYDILRDLDWVGNQELNPIAREMFIEKGFYSVKEINDFIKETGKDFELAYDKDNLLQCSEYHIFRGINYMADNCNFVRDTKFIDNFDEETIKLNKERRKKDLQKYLKQVAYDAVHSA